MLYTAGMNDEAGIRRANLRRLLDARGLGPTALSRAYKGAPTPPYWSDLRNGKKDFGEKAARDIEEGLGLPRGWLDRQGAEVPEPGTQRALPLEPAPAPSFSYFATLAAERIDKLPDEHLRESAYYLLIQMLDFGADVVMRPSSTSRSGEPSSETLEGAASARGAATPTHTRPRGR